MRRERIPSVRDQPSVHARTLSHSDLRVRCISIPIQNASLLLRAQQATMMASRSTSSNHSLSSGTSGLQEQLAQLKQSEAEAKKETQEARALAAQAARLIEQAEKQAQASAQKEKARAHELQQAREREAQALAKAEEARTRQATAEAEAIRAEVQRAWALEHEAQARQAQQAWNNCFNFTVPQLALPGLAQYPSSAPYYAVAQGAVPGQAQYPSSAPYYAVAQGAVPGQAQYPSSAPYYAVAQGAVPGQAQYPSSAQYAAGQARPEEPVSKRARGAPGTEVHAPVTYFAPGTKVKIVGLRSRLEYNDKTGRVQGFDCLTSRHLVKLEGSEGQGKATEIHVKMDNLQQFCEVQITGLASADGRRACIVGWLEPLGRYDARLGISQKRIGLLPENAILFPGTIVRIHEHATAQGHRGKIVGVNKEEKIYLVELYHGQIIKARFGSVRA
ncbi:hypothetical protein CYMTET_42758 [Cymbomonas tetramitiformis]|uniref:Uncharacterized protein n=1 Tax=Cymbomonas tetramitiformis TaxID=36881 RepID=A0AAE0F171_9CHLO|nr:hypothetical protein CYMTET_42758 [Cymbomonas tetramitiformis]